MNSDVLRTLFHKGDQRMLEAFTDLTLSLTEKSETCPELDSAKFSLTTREGIEIDTYDFKLSMDEWLGFEATDLRLIGTAKLGDDRETKFTAPVDLFKMEAEFIPEDNEDVLTINAKAQKPTVKEFTFDVSEITFDDSTVSKACETEILEGLIEGVMQMYDSIWNGDLDSLSVMPIESFLPLIMIRHVGGFALE